MDPDQGRRPSIRVTLSVSVCLPACLPVCLSVCLLQDTLKNQQRKKRRSYYPNLIHTAIGSLLKTTTTRMIIVPYLKI